MTYFLGPEIFVRFEKHQKVFSGALRDRFRAREVFGSFEKRTPGRINSSHLVHIECCGTVTAPKQKPVVYSCKFEEFIRLQFTSTDNSPDGLYVLTNYPSRPLLTLENANRQKGDVETTLGERCRLERYTSWGQLTREC